VGDHFGWHPSTGPDVNAREGHVFVNNLLTGDENYKRPLLAFSQMPIQCAELDKPQVKKLDYNVYVRQIENTSAPLIYWSPAKNEKCIAPVMSPDELHKMLPEFSANDRYFPAYNGPLFKNPKENNYHLLKSFPASASGEPLADEISRLMGLSQKDILFVGACPPVP
jgi:hypothetical protein